MSRQRSVRYSLPRGVSVHVSIIIDLFGDKRALGVEAVEAGKAMGLQARCSCGCSGPASTAPWLWRTPSTAPSSTPTWRWPPAASSPSPCPPSPTRTASLTWSALVTLRCSRLPHYHRARPQFSVSVACLLVFCLPAGLAGLSACLLVFLPAVFMPACLLVFLSACPLVFLFLPACWSFCLPTFWSLCLPACWPACLPLVFLPACLPAGLSACLLVFLPACLPAGFLPACLPTGLSACLPADVFLSACLSG